MMKHKEYIIPFSGLKQGKHEFEYNIENTFFESFEYNEFNGADIKLQVTLNKIEYDDGVGNEGEGNRKC